MADFGIFYPMGHIVVAFPAYDDAARVQQDLMTGGYDREDAAVYRCDEVVKASEQNLENHTGWLARLGKSDEMVKRHLAAAKQGAAFAVIYAPSDIEAERVMNVVRRVPFSFAHRYRRFAIQVMK